MEFVSSADLKNLYLPPEDSHKGQNGKLLVIGGSQLFHAASLWALKVASRIVDLVHYSSIPENNQIVYDLKKEFRDGIVVPREDIDSYIEEDDCILIGPGMTRDEETKTLTNSLLKEYSHKKWVIDAGALQMMDVALIPQNAILTPHKREFIWLIHKITGSKFQEPNNNQNLNFKITNDAIKNFAKDYNCIVLLKGETDICCSPQECKEIKGGNSGMTKGGTGDVLAGLVAALNCKNDAFLAATAASFINKTAGDRLFKRVGYYFNASDLADEIPLTLKEIMGI